MERAVAPIGEPNGLNRTVRCGGRIMEKYYRLKV